jgi:RNA polymerase sigma-70 factor (ECF subfamily)
LTREEEWEAFYVDERHRLWRSLVVYCRVPELASDATAEAFARSWQHWSSIRAPRAWVYRVAFSIASEEMRLRAPVESLSDNDVQGLDVYQDSDVIKALAALSPAQRGALVLHDAYGFTSIEVGRILICSASTARVHLARGRRRLRQLIGDQHVNQ